MKNLILSAFLLMSFSGFADIVSPQNDEDIINEIVASLEKNDLTCSIMSNNKKYKASELQIKIVFEGEVDLEILRGQQPVVNVTKDQDDNTFANMKVTTDSSYKVVTKLKILRYKVNEPTVERVNVGTIIDPEYKEIVTQNPDTILEDITCE